MRRTILALLSTVAALVLLLSFKTHSMTSVATPPAAIVPNSGSSSTGSTGTSGSSGTATSGSKTVTGDSVDTRWGPVQVRITRTSGRITAAEAIVYPLNNSRDREINAQAVPILEQEAVAANSAEIDMVSGATYTSEGYLSSLQSALDKAS